MIDALTVEDFYSKLIEREGEKNRIIGILFVRPNGKVASEEILRDINYFHFCSAENINFFLPGYGAYWPEDKYPDKKAVCKIENVEWSYSDKEFNDFKNHVQRISNWKYSGGAELLLIDSCSGILDFSNCINISLDKALKDQAIEQIDIFLEGLFNYVNAANRTVWTFSDRIGLNKLKEGLIDYLGGLLPSSFNKKAKEAAYFTVHNFSK